MGNVEVHDFSPVRDDERRELDLSRRITYKQYCKHVEGRPHEGCLHEIPWHIRDSVSLYERMSAGFNAITDLPNELPLRLPHLNYIDLSHNQLESLPESFGLLFHLKTLLLRYNMIKSLPASFVHLIKLEKLDLSHNLLKSLPNDFTKMESLTKFNVSHNKLKSLPYSLGGVKMLKLLIVCDNRLIDPHETICVKGSDAILAYLRKSYNLAGQNTEHLPASSLNVFPRNRGNHLQTSVPNPHSAQVEYIQCQTETANTASRVKTPLLPPPGATTLAADVLRDRIVGLVYGACIGDAVGLATCCMTPEECEFHYSPVGRLAYRDVLQDLCRVRWRPGDWTANFDKMMLVLDSIVAWAGVVDELDYAKRLHAWTQNGVPELGDSQGIELSETVKHVIEQADFLNSPHTAAKAVLHRRSLHNGGIPPGSHDGPGSDDDCSSVSSDLDHPDSPTYLLPSSYPCIPSHVLGTDNGAIVQTAVLGIPCFHISSEVQANTLRICRSTHADPRCVASCTVITCLVSLMLQGRYDLDSYKSVDDMIHKAAERGRQLLHDPDHIADFTQHCDITAVDAINVREKHNMSYTFKAMASALVALRSQLPFQSFLMKLIMEGGDSNSNGCVAGALLGCKLGYSHLPADWVLGLRNKQTTWLNARINLLLDMIGLP